MEDRLAAVEASQSEILDILKRLDNNVPMLWKTVAALSVTVDRLSHRVEGQSEDIGPSHVETVMPSSGDSADEECLVSVQQEQCPEMKAKRLCKAQRSSLDIISTLPQSIIETILCLVPLRDAVRTSVLSSKWRYNWVTIPKLVFNDKDMFDKANDGNQVEKTSEEPPNERKQLTKRCKTFYAIYQVLLMHQGPIHEFTFDMLADETCVEIDQIISLLSMHNNTLKKFTLELSYARRFPDYYPYMYRLPSSFFLLHQLTDLHLTDCDLDYEPTFSGFANLTSLYLNDVNISGEALVHLLSSCPLLKTLTLDAFDFEVDWGSDVTVEVLFKCLPMIEHLSISCSTIKYLAQNGYPRELPTSIVHLKYLYLEPMSFFDKLDISILGFLIRSSPNLEKLKIQIICDEGDDYEDSDMDSAMLELEDYSDISLEHLNELEIHDFSNLEPQVEFVKVILAKSPVLKRVMIVLENVGDDDEMLEMLRILLRSPHASPTVDITVETSYEYRLRLGLVKMQS